MASKEQIESWTELAICPICLDFFTDPVSLECGHNFCRSCITQCWEREGRNSCPECREVFRDRTVRVNRVLANLSEKARILHLNPKEKDEKLYCEKHQEELKLFCETDKKLICVICRDAREHRDHRFLPREEAVEIYKEQSNSLQSHITSQFADLHQILTEKEQRLLRNLLEEEKSILIPMEQNLQEIKKKLHSIQEELAKLQEQMDQKDGMIFLKEEAHQERRVNDDGQVLSVADGALPIGKFDQPFLLNTVLRDVVEVMKRVSVTLDVETGKTNLEVSKDRRSVRWAKTEMSLPDTGTRLTVWECVLGSEGFTSGRHYWEVKVASNRVWSVGVAAKSVKRRQWVALVPEAGIWTIGRQSDGFNVNTSPRSRLPANLIPSRVGVYLSYESGIVSFYNADTKSHLHTFAVNKFTEKLYPLFGTWDIKQWLTICSGSAPGV
ncbi:nuclear factor 7, brain-like isoform X2 [Amblyraja radiata]|uniref:nuclear factor 7, brain-like isoform X2 n=1 Tax=Amblyraja radiata TaxID=386614 RepID=UPI001403F63A|nr:nuclear factor 7, brain-like isoform X2 [Amblyraja radiata]